MKCCKRFFSDSKLGPVTAYTISNDTLELTVLNLGCIIQSWKYRGTDIVCGFDTADEYLNSSTYYGAIIGRVCNRGYDFQLHGTEYHISKNENGRNTLHGGFRGFDKQFWDVSLLENGLLLSRVSPDGEEGYPGNLTTNVRYLLDGSSFSIQVDAVCDQDTVVSFTNHSYFNLDGLGGDILKHKLYLTSWFISECDKNHVPTGNHLPIWGGPLDFNVEKELGKDLFSEEELMKVCKGYDHNYILRKAKPLSMVARLTGSKISMDLLTSLPCMQLYTANGKQDTMMKGHLPQLPYRAVCLETQEEPNSVNLNGNYLKADTHYQCETIYRFYDVEE